MTDIIKTYQTLEECFPMEEMRRLYLAKFGETVDGRLRLYGDWEISNNGALTTSEGEVLPFISMYCWFTFTEGTGLVVTLKPMAFPAMSISPYTIY